MMSDCATIRGMRRMVEAVVLVVGVVWLLERVCTVGSRVAGLVEDAEAPEAVPVGEPGWEEGMPGWRRALERGAGLLA